ncbi:MAG: hypothetical protein JWM91_1742 [Rhodospirillales bacterium]|nr:hypothetical protein [Rhodospirillales bacterium]
MHPENNATIRTPLLILLCMFMLSGCSDDTVSGRNSIDPMAPKRNMVALTNIDHDIHFVAGARLMTDAEAQSLAHFLTTSEVGGEGDAVTIGLSTGNSAKLAAERQASVLALLKHHHVVAVPAANPALGSNAIRLRVARYVASTPSCPDWSKPEADEPTNSPSSNFGCATEAAVALMVADPRDMLRGKPAGPADGEALGRGVALYRSGALSKSLGSSGGTSAAGISGTGGGGQ